jgi:hypothetical protein
MDPLLEAMCKQVGMTDPKTCRHVTTTPLKLFGQDIKLCLLCGEEVKEKK